MLSKPTTFVIGAGASCDFKFPTGLTLQADIARCLALDNDSRDFSNERLRQALFGEIPSYQWLQERTKLLQVGQKIASAMPAAASIDNFLHSHQNDPDVIKLGNYAIALSILEAEANSPIRIQRSGLGRKYALNEKVYRESWYFPFIRILTSGTLNSKPQDLFKNARFVVFNYDRCLEFVLLITLQNYYGVDESSALEILAQSEILHPYGSLGSLGGFESDGTPFGADRVDLPSMASKLQTFTESVASDTVDHVQKYITEAEVLVFLGFGFLSQNMELLRPNGVRNVKSIHATTFGISGTDKFVLQENLAKFLDLTIPLNRDGRIPDPFSGQFGSYIDVQNGTCTDLIQNHNMRLTI